VYWSKTNALTYSGDRIPENYSRKCHNWIALSNDLLKYYPIDSEVVISGISTSVDGVYVVKDKTNDRHRNLIDILCEKDSLKGYWYNIKIKKYGK